MQGQQLTARAYADLAMQHAQRAHFGPGRDQADRLAAARYVAAAGTMLLTEPGNDLVCRGVLHSALALLAIGNDAGDAGDTAQDADEALRNAQAALKLFIRAGDSPKIAMARANLGLAFAGRLAGTELTNVEQAIYHLEIALRDMRAGAQDWVDVAANLAWLYPKRGRGEVRANLDRAVGIAEGALMHVSRLSDPQRWADLQNSVGSAVLRRCADEQDQAEAVQRFGLALAATDRAAFAEQWADLHVNISKALADHPHAAPAALASAIDHLRQALLVYDRVAHPSAHLDVQRALGQKLMWMGCFEEAHLAFEAAIAVYRLLFAVAYTWAGRQAALRSSAGLFSRDAYCLIRLGRPLEALHRFEQGRARILQEKLALARLSKTASPATKRIAKAQAEVRRLEADHRTQSTSLAAPRELVESLSRARTNLADLVEALFTSRQEQPQSLQSMLGQAEQTSWIVALIVTESGSVSLVIAPENAAPSRGNVLELPSFDLESVRALVSGDEGWLRSYASRDWSKPAWHEALQCMCVRLWRELIGPILAHAQTLGMPEDASVAFMVPGALALLPLHAACPDKGSPTLCDRFTVSYAPSLSMLSYSQQFSRDGARPGSVLAIVDPTKDLPHARVEGEVFRQQFGEAVAEVLVGRKATVTRLVRRAPLAVCLHFACHGTFDFRDALGSSLRLAGGELSVADVLARVDLGRAGIVVLSGCETGWFEFAHAADEQLGLSSAMMQAGAAAVVSSLWPVNDLATSLLMRRFYSHYGAGVAAPAALREAQRWLKRATNEDLTKVLGEMRGQAGSKGLPEVRQLYARFALDPNRNAAPFSDPHYWAAFVAHGG